MTMDLLTLLSRCHCLLLTLCFVWGSNLAQGTIEIVELLGSALRGDAKAQYELAVCLDVGRGVPKDMAAAIMWYTKAAEQGDVKSQYSLAHRYFERADSPQGAPNDRVQGLKWFSKATAQGHAEAREMLNLFCLDDDNEHFERQVDLGHCYLHGYGISKNEREAVKLYRKSADKGFSVAQYYLALCYLQGTGVPQNVSEGMNLLRKAASPEEYGGFRKCPQAQFLLAFFCEKAGNMSEAMKWYRKAADGGFAEAQFVLANHYHAGNGVPSDKQEAEKWYKKAAEQGIVQAQFMLATHFHSYYWVYPAARQGHPGAIYLMGVLCNEGPPLYKCTAEARPWLQLAASLGLTEAQKYLRENF